MSSSKSSSPKIPDTVTTGGRFEGRTGWIVTLGCFDEVASNPPRRLNTDLWNTPPDAVDVGVAAYKN
jgi:hypothetical protein